MRELFFTLYFDASLAAAVLRLRDVLVSGGVGRDCIPEYRPHISIFPEKSVVFLAPRPVHALLELHRSVLETFSWADDPPIKYANLLPQSWVPHCTLAEAHPGSVATIVRTLQERWAPLAGAAEGIGILELPDAEDRLQLAFQSAPGAAGPRG